MSDLGLGNDTFWLTAANVAVGIATALCAAAVVIALLVEIVRRRRRFGPRPAGEGGPGRAGRGVGETAQDGGEPMGANGPAAKGAGGGRTAKS